jgi:hypothetical protein
MSRILTLLGSGALVTGSAIYAFRSSTKKKNVPVTEDYVISSETVSQLVSNPNKYEIYDDVGFRPFARVKDNLENSELSEWAKETTHQFTGDALLYAIDSWFWGMDMRSRARNINDFQNEIKRFISGGGFLDREFLNKGQFLPSELRQNEQ